MIDPKEAEEVVNKMIEQIGEDKFEEMRYQAYFYRIICSMYYSESADPDVLIKHIGDGFEGKVPVEQITNIVMNVLPDILEDEGFYHNDQLTDDAVMIAISHNKMLKLGYEKQATKSPKNTKHLH